MRKLLLALAALIAYTFVQAQQVRPVKELGVVFYNGDQYGLTYRFGTEKGLWRVNVVSADGFNLKSFENDFTQYNQNAFNLNLSFGREIRRYIRRSLALRLGADFSYAYSGSKTRTDSNNDLTFDQTTNVVTHAPGFNLMFGINVQLSNFLLGLEVKPNVQYNMKSSEISYMNARTSNTDENRFSYGLSTTPVQFSIVYQF